MLSDGSCSCSRPVTTAVFVIVPGLFGRTTTMIVTSSLYATWPIAQLIGLDPEQVPFVVETETSVTPEGSASVTTTLLAVSPFLFVTVSV